MKSWHSFWIVSLGKLSACTPNSESFVCVEKIESYKEEIPYSCELDERLKELRDQRHVAVIKTVLEQMKVVHSLCHQVDGFDVVRLFSEIILRWKQTGELKSKIEQIRTMFLS